ncbi:MAG: M2 family metallopeptidase [Flavobacteriales bacterium]|nr:M2 family metallopeptidase [Flavobacteriales bacterium]
MLACGSGPEESAQSAKVYATPKEFLDEFDQKFQDLYTKAQEQEWLLNTHIVDGDTLTEKRQQAAMEALSGYLGSDEVVNAAKGFLEKKDSLTPLEVRQMEAILYMAASSPASVANIVKAKIAADARQTTNLFKFTYTLNDKEVSTNQLDSILAHSTNETDLRQAWEASKTVGKVLKDGVDTLRLLRNQCVQALGYKDYFAYQVSEYGMSTDEMKQLCNQMVVDLWPLYRELHTWARYRLAKRFNAPVPDMTPAHWLPNRWGQAWGDIVSVEGLDVDGALKDKEPSWIVEKGEDFYMSLGFPKLPEVFYEKSSLYPAPADAGYKKNNHASAWHINLEHDVRSLMSVESNARWWGTTLHELGHIYYFLAYSTPEVPITLRNGANRGYHEALGSLMGLAAVQKPFLVNFGLADANAKTDDIQILLKEALENVTFIPWSAGVMTFFEHYLYSENLPKDQFNARWWEYKKKYQGIVPPSDRGEDYCDAATKTHINNDAAQYYDYAISYILMYQFHDYISKNILKQDPHATNYYGNKEVGAFIGNMMKTGATIDWREHLQQAIGSELSAKPMLEYFAPLMDWLKTQNKGRTYTLPEQL